VGGKKNPKHNKKKKKKKKLATQMNKPHKVRATQNKATPLVNVENRRKKP
jgi:hypothetical protein